MLMVQDTKITRYKTMELVKVTEFLTEYRQNGELVAISWGNGGNNNYACLYGVWEPDSQNQIVTMESLLYLRGCALEM